MQSDASSRLSLSDESAKQVFPSNRTGSISSEAASHKRRACLRELPSQALRLSSVVGP